jgi:osmotically-inducible protein OsmY
MRKHLYMLAMTLGLTAGLVLAQGAPQTQQPAAAGQDKPGATNTASIQNEIQSAIQKDPSLAGSNISVQVTDKSVELSGSVQTKDAKDSAEQIAKQHAGSLEVKNRIKVEKSPASPSSNLKPDQPKR